MAIIYFPASMAFQNLFPFLPFEFFISSSKQTNKKQIKWKNKTTAKEKQTKSKETKQNIKL